MCSPLKQRGDGWYVQWKELVVTRDEHGVDHREWKTRGQTFPTERSATEFSREVAIAAAKGERFVDKREAPVVTLKTIALGYVRAAVESGVPLATRRYRSSMLATWLTFAGEDKPASALTLTLLEGYSRSLPAEGRQTSTRHRRVLLVEQMWRWAHDRPEQYPGVPVPRRYTAGSGESDKLRAPPPVVAVAAPTFADVDAFVGKLLIPWHVRIALVMRYTGLRASQASGMDWRDVDLEGGGAPARPRACPGREEGRARVFPLHPALVEEMAGWASARGFCSRVSTATQTRVIAASSA
ncbi:MAG: hypothetical protein Q8P41_32460 [Pseudomonadota bacterium]|nr:hypothetical protein [Pseudomonadota bacterium]